MIEIKHGFATGTGILWINGETTMRPTKFRGKRRHDKTWAYGGIYTEKNIAVIIETFAHFEHVFPETVGQFTGCYDANRKEIYEGDIVQIHFFCERSDGEGIYEAEKTIRGKLEIKPFGLWIECNNDESGYLIHKIPSDDGIKIIGNIHDNPEMVQG